jgi:hypothetical protein
MSVLNDDNQVLLENFNINLRDVYFYIIKRLNRYQKCTIRIPLYDNNDKKWTPRYSLTIQECNKKTYLNNRKVESMCGMKDLSLGETKNTIICSMMDNSTKYIIYYYVFKNRNEMLEKYINLMREALKLRKTQYGIDYNMGGN